MSLKKYWLTYFVSVFAIILLISAGCGEKKVDEQNAETSTEQSSNISSDVADVDVGLPIYPGSEQDPNHTPINTPHMKNIKILASDSFDEVVACYTEKLGEFQIDEQEKGNQALWNKETDGTFQSATISTILSPEGKVTITLVKGNNSFAVPLTKEREDGRSSYLALGIRYLAS